MNQKHLAMLAALGLGAAALTGCQTTATMEHDHGGMDPVPAAGLTATEWKVSQIDGAAVPAGFNAVLRFQSNGTLTGSLGCNNGSAQYKHSGHMLTIGNMVSTKMACDQMAWETKLANALTATQHVQLTGTNGLALYDGQMAVRVTLQPR